jgi:hypothetical protein
MGKTRLSLGYTSDCYKIELLPHEATFVCFALQSAQYKYRFCFRCDWWQVTLDRTGSWLMLYNVQQRVLESKHVCNGIVVSYFR